MSHSAAADPAGLVRCSARSGAGAMGEELLAVERPLQLLINGAPFAITMRTPGDDTALAVGLLLSEGIIALEAVPNHIEVRAMPESAPDLDVLDIRIAPIYLCPNLSDHRSLAMNSACGICGQRSWQTLALPPVIPLPPPDVAVLSGLFQQMYAGQPLFAATGACHAAAGFSADFHLLHIAEDVGRHNAVDRVIGHAALQNESVRILTVSGRISYEIVGKAWRGGISVLAGVSAPTSLAVATAAQAGMHLFGFCRDGRATLYTPWP